MFCLNRFQLKLAWIVINLDKYIYTYEFFLIPVWRNFRFPKLFLISYNMSLPHYSVNTPQWNNINTSRQWTYIT